MGSHLLQRLYDRVPPAVQGMLLNAYALRLHHQRYGKRFTEVSSKLRETQWFSREQIEAYQSEKLRRLVHYAYETVPYYKEVFDHHRIDPRDIRTTADLAQLPLLTKEQVREHTASLISRAVHRKSLVHGHTSGTTGSPLDIYWDRDTCIINNAVDWRQKEWAGVSLGEPMALLLGRPIVALERTRPPFWQLDRIHNQLWMSSFHMSETNLHRYFLKLLEYKPVAIEGYPSTLFVFARFLLAADLRLPLKAAFSSSETLHDIQREAIEEAFQCKLFDYYGMAERVVFATECAEHDGRHLNFEFGITEIVDDSGARVSDGRPGFVVGTSLANFGMPLIRYKTSDVTRIHATPCPCGRAMPLIDAIATKAEDMVIRPDGTPISPSVLTHPFKPFSTIAKSQIVQDRIGHIVIKIVRKAGFSEENRLELLEAFQKRVGPTIEVETEYAEDIPRSASGKYRWVISKVGNAQSPIR